MPSVLRLLCLALLVAACSAFVAPVPAARASPRAAVVRMGNDAPDGPFTPIVLAGKVVLGEKTFNKVRGKAISIHSQLITEFSEDYGVPREMRGALIKKAKTTGARLGFLS